MADKSKIATATMIDHAAALQDAALAGGDFLAAEAHAGEAVADVTGKIGAQNAQLVALQAQLLAASTAAETFSQAMRTAMKVDSVGAGIKAIEAEIKQLEAGLEAAPDHSTESTVEMGRTLDMACEKLKQFQQQQADPDGLGRDLLKQDSDALTHFDNTYRGSDQARLANHIAILRGLLANDQLNAQQRFKLNQDLEAS
jgi:hypothetical protein